MNLNLEKLGITKESLTQAILSELSLSPEAAVEALAKELGVETAASVSAKAVEVSDSDVQILRQAAAIQTRIFS